MKSITWKNQKLRLYVLMMSLFFVFSAGTTSSSILSQSDDSSKTEVGIRPTGVTIKLQTIAREKAAAATAGDTPRSDPITVRIPVILGDFVDQAHIFDSSAYQELLFGDNPTGSMTDYYNEVSYGQLNITGQVYGPYVAPETRSYYESGGYPSNFVGYAFALLDSADQYIDFGEYDNDGLDGIPNSGDDDGVVDVVHFIFPDTGAADSQFRGAYSMFWLAVTGVYETNDARTGGGMIIIDEFIRTAGETKPSSLNEINPIGGPVHEFGHVLGLPDQYDGDGSSNGLGTWCLMSLGTSGACNCEEGKIRPIHLCAWCKTLLGFMAPIDVVGTEHVAIPPVETNPVVFRLWDDAYQGERYFLLENRTRIGFDSDIAGEGVLIWHCNGDATIDNDYEGFRMIDLEEADGLDQLDDKSSIMDDGDPFPGSTNNTSFNDATTPASTDIFGDPTGVSAEGFTYVSGPGSDVMVTLTQRTLEGFTLSYHAFASTSFFGTSNAVVKYGATRFTTTEEGLLVGIQTGVKQDNSYDYNVRVFDDMIGGSPSGLHSTTSGTFPSVPTKRWIDMALSDSLMLAADQTFLVDVGFGPTPYPVPYVHQYPLSGQSYKSNDGTIYESWTDKDVMIRARIKYMCCGRFTSGYTGNTDCDTEGKMSLADVTKLIDRVYLSKTPLCCEENGNVDGDPEGKMALADITKLIDHIYLSKAETAACE